VRSDSILICCILAIYTCLLCCLQASSWRCGEQPLPRHRTLWHLTADRTCAEGYNIAQEAADLRQKLEEAEKELAQLRSETEATEKQLREELQEAKSAALAARSSAASMKVDCSPLKASLFTLRCCVFTEGQLLGCDKVLSS